jgi:EamA domain-containing membrane protein RarD
LENKPQLPPAAMWTFVVATTLALVVLTVRLPKVLPLFLAISWCAVAVSLAKSFIPLDSWKPLMMETLFLVQAAAITLWARESAKCKEE